MKPKWEIDLEKFTRRHRETCHGRCPACQLLDRIEELEQELVEERQRGMVLEEHACPDAFLR